jgi:hypothetical protein
MTSFTDGPHVFQSASKSLTHFVDDKNNLPDVKFESPLADDAAEDRAGVDADPHVDGLMSVLVELADGRNH